jgi:drug/metabolite transporter (DMT)-like permease
LVSALFGYFWLGEKLGALHLFGLFVVVADGVIISLSSN